ncbi:MAG: hypothetical protein N2746_11985 [Deltaproteobacteria bacterium]|nr:hypothetical protein [Deltaproteobacteria bacterium]
MQIILVLGFLILCNISCSDDNNTMNDTFIGIKDVFQIKDENLVDHLDTDELPEINSELDILYSEDDVSNDIEDILDIQSSDTGIVNILNISLIMQLENSNVLNSKSELDNFISKIDDLTKLFEKYNAKISFEAKEIVSASVKYKSNFLNQLVGRGHSVNLHADTGFEYGINFSDFVQKLREKKEELERLSIIPLSVSGICSQLDWVAASFNVGFAYITSITAYCLKSLPLESQPDFVKSCIGHLDCQQLYPFESEKKLFPWRAKLGSDWRVDDEEGLMVLMPSFSRLPCIQEEYRNTTRNISNCVFDNFDIERSLDIIEESMTKFDNEKINVIIFIWNLQTDIDKNLLEKWLNNIDYYVKKQKLRWMNTDEIYNKYIRKN